MGLFSKKPACPICGGKVSWLLPSKIEDEYICNTCFNKIDMENDKRNSLTMQGLREYLMFYDQNQLLKNKFVVFEQIDFGILDTKIIFDNRNKLFCMSNNPDKTVFEGRELKSLTISEDDAPLYECSAESIRRFTSTVPDRAMAMAPKITKFMVNKQVARAVRMQESSKESKPAPVQYFNESEPFRAFNIELHFDHPYWSVIKCDMKGPRFDRELPDVNNYIVSYRKSIEEIEKIVTAFRKVAFPNAQDFL